MNLHIRNQPLISTRCFSKYIYIYMGWCLVRFSYGITSANWGRCLVRGLRSHLRCGPENGDFMFFVMGKQPDDFMIFYRWFYDITVYWHTFFWEILTILTYIILYVMFYELEVYGERSDIASSKLLLTGSTDQFSYLLIPCK